MLLFSREDAEFERLSYLIWYAFVFTNWLVLS